MFRRGALLGSQPPAGKEEPPAAREKRPPEITGSKGRASEIRSRETQLGQIHEGSSKATSHQLGEEKKGRMDGTVQGERGDRVIETAVPNRPTSYWPSCRDRASLAERQSPEKAGIATALYLIK
jgi:hypothetical protein